MSLTVQRQNLTGLERPYSGQLWRRESLQAIIVAMGPTTITYDNLTRGGRQTEKLDAFLALSAERSGEHAQLKVIGCSAKPSLTTGV